jgi:hypothetical protein
VFQMPNVDHIIAGFRKDIDRLDEKLTNIGLSVGELTTIRMLLARLVELEEEHK